MIFYCPELNEIQLLYGFSHDGENAVWRMRRSYESLTTIGDINDEFHWIYVGQL